MKRPKYLTPNEADELLRIPYGKSARLARRGLLPHVLLPDGSVRFDCAAVLAAVKKATRKGSSK
jgi:hypothetical protein